MRTEHVYMELDDDQLPQVREWELDQGHMPPPPFDDWMLLQEDEWPEEGEPTLDGLVGGQYIYYPLGYQTCHTYGRRPWPIWVPQRKGQR